MKRVLPAIAVVLAVLFAFWFTGGGGDVDAQPITGGGGLTRVYHTPAFYGLGTSGTNLDLRHDCSSGSGLAWDGSAWSCAAMGGSGGGGGGSGFTIAGAGLVGSGSAINVTATAGGMIAVGSDSIGLDGSGCTAGWVPVWGGSTWSCAAVSAGSAAFVSISQTATTGTPNLTTLGTSDWIVFNSNTPSNSVKQYWTKLTGGRQIERPVWMGTIMSNIATSARTQAVTWTATDNISQGSAGGGWNTAELAFSAAGTNFGFVTSAPSSTIARTFTIYVANFNETDAVTCSAVLADHEYAQQNVSFTMSGIDNRTLTVIYNSQQATRINVWCFITAGPNTNLGWLAMWLA